MRLEVPALCGNFFLCSPKNEAKKGDGTKCIKKGSEEMVNIKFANYNAASPDLSANRTSPVRHFNFCF